MKRIAWTIPVALAALLCAGCNMAHEPHPDVKSVPQVMAAYKAFEEAWEREDLAAATAPYLSNAVVFDPVPPGRFDGIDAIRGWTEGSFKAMDDISIEASRMKLHVVGPAAWITAHYVFTATMAGQSARFEGDMTVNFLRDEDDAWKIAVFHASHMPTP